MSEDTKPVKRRATAKKVNKKFKEEMTDEKWAERRNTFSSLFGPKPAEPSVGDDNDIITQLVENANRMKRREETINSLFGKKPAEATAAVTVKEVAVDDITTQLVEKANRENYSKGGKRKTKKNKKSLTRRKRKYLKIIKKKSKRRI